MFKSILLLGVAAISFTSPSYASSAHEMKRSELRQVAMYGNTVSMKATLSSVSNALHAKVVEARAFDAGGVYYRFVLKRPDGRLVSVIIDAQTGDQVPSNSSVGCLITEAASVKHVKLVPSATRSNGM
ncbi:MAG: hypothetical protein ABJN34_07440 [Litoreibacter sp.]|uniref:PepSY domain-containing protein n=1 Tax=Litoreibacter sp. TaxID=1969459 RepID=UPI003298D1FF